MKYIQKNKRNLLLFVGGGGGGGRGNSKLRGEISPLMALKKTLIVVVLSTMPDRAFTIT